MATVPNGFRRSRNTPTLARVGEERDASYSTGPQDCVQAAGPGPEWSNKPPVVASYAVIRLCEELVGAQITITARCVRARGCFSSWQVTVRDSHETVGEGRMDFVAVHRPHYEARRLEPKRAALTSALSTA
ncbi:hypothetical protein K7711_06620 [Nocardia sp. CA2R105]|uniref:hypothetical protein n=1 Tax=Nocardia coffeae TaxID=2873381 RepID=UPI001CA6F45F|nr:hypothetical protein [Nocardia coffeae]MBY8856143.1 hypothetical protein [Nocardia coffeae]